MRTTADLQQNPCIVAGVQPLLAELRDSIRIQFRNSCDTGREPLEAFIHATFHRSFGATLHSFYPNLTAFTAGDQIRGVVGYRDAEAEPLFSEQYLDAPVEELIADRFEQRVERRHLVEVGNLALASLGEARWTIAAMTVFLHAAGYRWVLFTAIRPLFNAFQRLGLQPIQIAVPDPARLPDGGRLWGRYYQAGPLVCAGSIEAGYTKLRAHVSPRQPRLLSLLHEAQYLGSRVCQNAPLAASRAV